MPNAPNPKILDLLWLFTGVVGFLFFAWKIYASLMWDSEFFFPYAEGADFAQMSPVATIGIIFCRAEYLLAWFCSIPGLIAQCQQFNKRYCYQWMLYSLFAVSVLTVLMIFTNFILDSVYQQYPTKEGLAYGISNLPGSWLMMMGLSFLLLLPGMALYPFQFLYDKYTQRDTSPAPADPFDGIETVLCPNCGERISEENENCPMCGSQLVSKR